MADITSITLAVSIGFENEPFPACSFPERSSSFHYTNDASIHPTSTESNSSTLSMIAASARDLEAILPQVRPSGEKACSLNQADQTSSTIGSATTWPSKRSNLDDGVQDESIAKLARAAADLRANIRGNDSKSPNSSARHSRSKVRGKFTDSRRKEVQEVRKKGACIRCRMLRKTAGSCMIMRETLLTFDTVFWRRSLWLLQECRGCSTLEESVFTNATCT